MRTIDIVVALLLVLLLTGCALTPTMDTDVAESIIHLDKMVVRVVKDGEDDPALKEATLLLSERLRKLAETELKIQEGKNE